MAKQNFKSVNYINNIGQELVPGDKVITVTSGYGHCVSTNVGVYKGLYTNDRVAVAISIKSARAVFIETNEDVPIRWYNNLYAEIKRTSKEPSKDYNKILEEKIKRVPITYERMTCLQLNRVYKIV